MTLRGPLDADKFRTTHYGARHYIDPLPPCDLLPEVPDGKLPAFTSIKKIHQGVFKKKWNGRTYDLDGLRAARYVAEQKEHLLKLDDDGLIDAVASAAQRDLRKAAERGTGVHTLLEDKAAGRSTDMDFFKAMNPDAALYIDVVEALWAEQAPVIGMEEVVGLNWSAGYGCTADAFDVQFNSFPGQRLAIDWKTRGPDSNHGCYETECLQLAAANGVEYMFVDDGTGQVARLKPPAMDLGVIVSIRPDGYELYPVDLAEAWQGWLHTIVASSEMKLGAKHGRAAKGKAIFVQPVVAAAPVNIGMSESAPPEQDPFARLPDETGRPQVDRVALTAALVERVKTLIGLEATIVWPADVPTFKAQREAANLHTEAELALIEKAIIAAERNVAAPFPEESGVSAVYVQPDDPRLAGIAERLLKGGEGLVEKARALGFPKLSSGAATEEQLQKVLTEIKHWEDCESDLVAAAYAEHPQGPAIFLPLEDGTWRVDNPRIVVDVLGGKRAVLALGRAQAKTLELGVPKNADEVLASPALVAGALLASMEAA